MATDLVRVSAYVRPELAALIDEVAHALGQSRSSTVAEALDAAQPVLEVLRDLARQLQAAPEKHREALESLAAGLRPMTDQASDLVASLERLAADPRPVTRGSE